MKFNKITSIKRGRNKEENQTKCQLLALIDEKFKNLYLYAYVFKTFDTDRFYLILKQQYVLM